jgi:DNA-binding transcriptional MerR regulator
MFIDSFSAKRAVEICGFGTVAMLDYLERSGVFVRERGEKRRGKGRRYTFRDLLVLKVIKALLDHGTSVAALRKALTEFQSARWKAEPTVLEDSLGGLRYLIASGGSVYFAHNTDILVDLSNRGQLAFSFILDLDRLHGELCRDMGLPTLQGELLLQPAVTKRARGRA